MMLHPGDAVFMRADGLVYPLSLDTIKVDRLIGYISPRETENIDEAWITSPNMPEERLFKLAPGYWVGPTPPYERDEPDAELLDAIEVYLEHR